eukprot:scaffold1060_cov109-Cylindrotheca_fusiformis.AAC.7
MKIFVAKLECENTLKSAGGNCSKRNLSKRTAATASLLQEEPLEKNSSNCISPSRGTSRKEQQQLHLSFEIDF